MREPQPNINDFLEILNVKSFYCSGHKHVIIDQYKGLMSYDNSADKFNCRFIKIDQTIR